MMKAFFYSTLIFATFATPTFASVTVNSPASGAVVGSPFVLSANALSCSSQDTAAMGYSLDNSSDTTIVKGTAVQTQIASGIGTHTLHVKAWGDAGSACVTDITITVESAPSTPMIPSGAESTSGLQILSNWVAQHDEGGGGGSIGSMSLVNSPSRSGNARKFVSNYSNYGDQRFDVLFGDDTTSTNFFYDVWIYLPYPSTSIANLEMDMNQVMPNGETVIYGFQCDGWSGTWDFTANSGTPTRPVDAWLHSKASCNPRQWITNTWHHVQVSYSRDGSGNVTYQSVWLDGAQSALNVTVPSAFALGWAPALLTNFQIDGSTPANAIATAYVDDLTIYRW